MTVYVTLGRMEEKGFIMSRLEPAPPDAGGLPGAYTNRRRLAAESSRPGRTSPGNSYRHYSVRSIFMDATLPGQDRSDT